MSVVRRTLPHPPLVVFDALVSPETYPEWLVGCREIRAVDTDWPAVESRFHHRVGLVGPLTVEDSTKVLEIDAPHRLQLEVRARPLGRGKVTFTLQPDGLERTVLTFEEVPIGILAPTQPLVDPLTNHRNQHSITRLQEFLDRERDEVDAEVGRSSTDE
jgi:uncharacterized protein YndB with AHSA1/START domain